MVWRPVVEYSSFNFFLLPVQAGDGVMNGSSLLDIGHNAKFVARLAAPIISLML